MMENCLNCANKQWEKLIEQENEQIIICRLDNHYIGYPEDANNETCNEWESE